jgi:hypothetical protein
MDNIRNSLLLEPCPPGQWRFSAGIIVIALVIAFLIVLYAQSASIAVTAKRERSPSLCRSSRFRQRQPSPCRATAKEGKR